MYQYALMWSTPTDGLRILALRAELCMRVSFIIPFDGVAGGIRVVAEYAQRLAERGHCARVFSPPPTRPEFGDRVRKVAQRVFCKPDGEHESHFSGTGVEVEFVDDLSVDRDLPDADIVVATWWKTAEWVSGYRASAGKKIYLVQGHETFVGQPIEDVRRTYRSSLQKVCVSNWLARVMRQEYGDSDTIVIPNAADSTRFFAPPRGKRERFSVGFTYSAAPCKAIDHTIEAVSLARELIPDLEVRAFGRTRPARHHRRLIDCYEQAPRQSRLPEIYASSDVWLFGSRSEGFGLPILEAMACRTPVIATPAGAAPEIVNEQVGVLTRPADPADMAAAIAWIYRMSSADWKQMSDRAFQRSRSWSWEDAADVLELALGAAVSDRWRSASARIPTEGMNGPFAVSEDGAGIESITQEVI